MSEQQTQLANQKQVQKMVEELKLQENQGENQTPKPNSQSPINIKIDEQDSQDSKPSSQSPNNMKVDEQASSEQGQKQTTYMQQQTVETQNQTQQPSAQQQAEPELQQQRSAQQQQQQQQFLPATQPQTSQYVNVNRQSVQFGKTTLFPGSIQQVDVTIDLNQQMFNSNDKNPLLLRVIAKCSNQQFNDLDQYVFSVRSNQRYEYFEEVRFKIRNKERAQVKVAVKVPPVKESYKIIGILEIQLENIKPMCLPIYVNCQIPEITCLKKLFKDQEKTWMIKIPAKKNQIRMPPIPFKNLSNYNFTMQVQAITSENFAKRPYDIIVQNFVNCQANGQFFVNLQLKENMNYQGPMPTKDTIRKILILKIKNSSVYFNFPMQIQVFESSNNSGMS